MRTTSRSLLITHHPHALDFPRQVCYMAYRLGMPTLVYRAKLDLHATPTALLVERLKQSLNNVKCAEFVEAIVEVLARRIAYEEQEVEPFSGIPYELMEDMLKSSELRIIDINCIETFVEQYQSLRAANHGKQPTPTSALRLHRLVQILVDLRRSVHPIHRALHLRACTFSAELPPWKMIRDMTDEVQERLRRSDPENAPAQGRRSEAVDAELARIQRALKDLGSSRSSKQSINGSGELQRPRSKSVGATLWSGVKARTKLRTAVAIMLESVQEHRSKNVANLPRIATEPHSLTGSSIDTKDPRAKSHDGTLN